MKSDHELSDADLEGVVGGLGKTHAKQVNIPVARNAQVAGTRPMQAPRAPQAPQCGPGGCKT